MLDNIFLQMSVLMGLTVSIAFIVRLLKQPLMIAYIIAGIVAGPVFLGVIHHEQESFHAFAELGVVLLLYVVGLSLNFEYIKRVGKGAIIGGVGQVLFTGAVGWFLLRVIGFSMTSSIFLAIATTFSSTIVIIKLLTDKKDLDTIYGRFTVGILLVQDVIAIFLLIFIKTMESGGSWAAEFGMIAVKGLLIVAAIYFLARVLLPPLLDRIAESGEFLFLFTIAWCFGVASLVYALGLSLEIGAVLAGISLGSSPYSHEISSRIRPLRDFFIVLFFIILGSEMGLAELKHVLIPSIVISSFILIGNPLILYIIYRTQKFTRRNAFLIGLTAAQVSEFGFIVLFSAQSAGLVGGSELATLTFTALTTIFISSYLITYNEQIYQFLQPIFAIAGPDKYQQQEQGIANYDIWVIGYHRIGWKVCQTLKEQKKHFAVIDYNPQAISRLKHQGIPAFYGDIADVEFLSELPIEQAKMIISTVPEPDDQMTLIKHIRKENKKSIIIANLHHARFVKQLYAAGANYVMMPHLLGGLWISEVLLNSRWTKKTFQELKSEQKKEMAVRFQAGVHD
jgi:Kef-type K+ transport system membrane component KefB